MCGDYVILLRRHSAIKVLPIPRVMVQVYTCLTKSPACPSVICPKVDVCCDEFLQAPFTEPVACSTLWASVFVVGHSCEVVFLKPTIPQLLDIYVGIAEAVRSEER